MMFKCFKIYITYLLFFLMGLTTNAQQPLRPLVKEDIFSHPPFKSCHAATICSLRPDYLIAAWFGGDHEGSPDVSIWSAFRKNGKWTSPAKIAEGKQENGERLACWNPVLFRHKNGLLYLHYKVGANPRNWKAFFKTSSDSGLHWSAAMALPDSLLGPIKNKPLQLSNGDILYPSSRESTDEKTWTAHIEKSSNTLSAWSIQSIPSNDFGMIQPTLLQYKNGRIQALLRSRQNVIVQSWSDDNGNHWSTPSALDLPNPNSGIDAASLSNGTQLLVYNPMKAGSQWWEGRSVLKIASSTDGIHWKDIYTLEEHADGEYSYPAIIVDDQQHIHIVYTAKREVIRYIELY